MSQASLTSANTNTQPKAHANHQSVPAVHTSPTSSTINQHTPPSQPPLESMPEEVEENLNDQEGGASKQPTRTGRRREGTMNKSFKFPPDREPAPSVPDIPKDLPTVAQKPRPSAEDKRARKSEESYEVAMVAPSSVEVPPPPPIEKEQTTSSVSDLDDVGETEEISLN